MNTKIEIINKPEFDSTSLDNFSLNNFNRWPGVDKGMICNHLKHILTNYGGLIFAASINGTIAAVLALRKLEWDTNFFNFNCYKIDYLLANNTYDENVLSLAVKQLIDHYFLFAKKNNIKFSYCSIDSSNRIINRALVEKRFMYLLAWVDGFYKSEKIIENNTDSENNVGLIKENELEFFKDIAADNYFKEGRFYLDSRFDIKKVDKMYSELISNSYLNKDILLVYRINDRPVGLFICKRIETFSYFNAMKIAPLRFLIIEPTQRGKGLSYDFFCKTLNYLKNYSDIVTTGLEIHNIPSLNLHSKLNFTFNYTHNLYHYWH